MPNFGEVLWLSPRFKHLNENNHATNTDTAIDLLV